MSEQEQPRGRDYGNTTFHSFKESGKWYATGRGRTSESTFRTYSVEDREAFRRKVLSENEGKYPGLSSEGREFTWVIVPDEEAYGYPLMVRP